MRPRQLRGFVVRKREREQTSLLKAAGVAKWTVVNLKTGKIDFEGTERQASDFIAKQSEPEQFRMDPPAHLFVGL